MSRRAQDFLILFGVDRNVLRGEVLVTPGHTVIIGTAVDLDLLVEVAVRGRGGRLPLEGGGAPGVVVLDLMLSSST